jgi:hypothetical protein
VAFAAPALQLWQLARPAIIGYVAECVTTTHRNARFGQRWGDYANGGPHEPNLNQ